MLTSTFTRALTAALATSVAATLAPFGAPAQAVISSELPDTVLVSATSTGQALDRFADRPQISGNGRYVVFDTNATNAIPGLGARTDVRRVYRKDTVTGRLDLVSALNGTEDGRLPTEQKFSSFGFLDDTGNLVAFVSDNQLSAAPKAPQRGVYVRNMTTFETRLVSTTTTGTPLNGASSRPMISGNGRFVAFSSKATNFGSTSGQEQVYVKDTVAGTTTLVSVAPDGTTAGDWQSYRGMVSDDGRYATWAGKAGNLTSVANTALHQEAIYTRDLVTGITKRITIRPDGKGGSGSRPYMTPDGRYVAFNSYDVYTPGDAGLTSDTFIWDRTTGQITRVAASDNVATPTTDPEDAAGDSLRLFLSDDGRFATWNSFDNKLVPNDKNAGGDAFYKDRDTGKVTLLSQSWYGGSAQGRSFRPVFSNDGDTVAYQSNSRLLVPNDPSTAGDQIYLVHASSVTGTAPDTTKPTATGTLPAAGSTVVGTGSVRFSGTASDDRSVDKVFVQIRDNATNKWLQLDGTWGATARRIPTTLAQRYHLSTDWSLSQALPPGRYAFNTVVMDASANTTTSATTSFTFSSSTPDTTVPTVTPTAPAAGASAGSPVTFTGTAADDTGVSAVTVQIRRNADFTWLQPNGTWGTSPGNLAATLGTPGGTSTTWSLTSDLAPGDYGWQVFSTDAAGNKSTKPFRKVIVPTPGPSDTTAPTVVQTAPAAGSTSGSPVTFTGTADDDTAVAAVTVQIRRNADKTWLQPNGTWGANPGNLVATLKAAGTGSTGWTFTTALPTGDFGWQAFATDTAGNRSTKPFRKVVVG